MLDFIMRSLIPLRFQGINYIIFLDHFALIVPTKEEGEPGDPDYIIPIQDEQAWKIASGVDQISFYVLP
jgi:hypothetical protein